MRYFAIVVLLCAVTAICQAEERWALLVGIDEYFNEGITSLKGAVRDAQVLRDMLSNAQIPQGPYRAASDRRSGNTPDLGTDPIEGQQVPLILNDSDWVTLRNICNR